MTRILRIGRRKAVWLILFVLMLAVNLIAWNSRSFCDWHVEHVLPVMLGTLGRLMTLVPFSVGEWLLLLAVFAIAACLLCGILLLYLRICAKLNETAMQGRGARGKAAFLAVTYLRIAAWIFLVVCIIMTSDCAILYHASGATERYMPDKAGHKYTIDQLEALRNYLVEESNALAPGFARDKEGMLLTEGALDIEAIKTEALASVAEASDTYEILGGYTPRPKYLTASAFFSQQNITGYYFPFTMEANYNRLMYVTNLPFTLCHELSHLKGFLREDDANMMAYLICVQSSDPFYRYSGYLNVYNYVNNAYWKALGGDRERYFAQPALGPEAKRDNIFLTEEVRERIEKKALIDTETVQKASNTFTDVTLKVNGVQEGMKSYSGVVGLLLYYYEGRGEIPGL